MSRARVAEPGHEKGKRRHLIANYRNYPAVLLTSPALATCDQYIGFLSAPAISTARPPRECHYSLREAHPVVSVIESKISFPSRGERSGSSLSRQSFHDRRYRRNSQAFRYGSVDCEGNFPPGDAYGKNVSRKRELSFPSRRYQVFMIRSEYGISAISRGCSLSTPRSHHSPTRYI